MPLVALCFLLRVLLNRACDNPDLLLFRGADFATTQLSKEGAYSAYVTDLIDKAG